MKSDLACSYFFVLRSPDSGKLWIMGLLYFCFLNIRKQYFILFCSFVCVQFCVCKWGFLISWISFWIYFVYLITKRNISPTSQSNNRIYKPEFKQVLQKKSKVQVYKIFITNLFLVNRSFSLFAKLFCLTPQFILIRFRHVSLHWCFSRFQGIWILFKINK